MSTKEQISLFEGEELEVNVNGVRGVNSVDVYDIKFPDKYNVGGFVEMKNFVKPKEYILHSSGSFHYFKNISMKRDTIPAYFNKPVFPWIQSVHNKSGKIRVPGVPQTKSPYPFLSLGEKNKKVFMHTLVASAFIPRPEDDKHIIVSHKNDMKWDYRAKNLFWNTHKNNSVGFELARRMDPFQIYDKWFEEFKLGREYDIGNFEDDEEDHL